MKSNINKHWNEPCHGLPIFVFGGSVAKHYGILVRNTQIRRMKFKKHRSRSHLRDWRGSILPNLPSFLGSLTSAIVCSSVFDLFFSLLERTYYRYLLYQTDWAVYSLDRVGGYDLRGREHLFRAFYPLLQRTGSPLLGNSFRVYLLAHSGTYLITSTGYPPPSS